MAGHPLLIQEKVKRSQVFVGQEAYNLEVSFHKFLQLESYAVGIKFSDFMGSMDSSKSGNINPFSLASVLGHKAVSLIRPDIEDIGIIGFYLLTEDLEARRDAAVSLKKRLYGNQAKIIHDKFKDRLPELNILETKGGIGWSISEYKFESYNQFKVFENELGKIVECFAIDN